MTRVVSLGSASCAERATSSSSTPSDRDEVLGVPVEARRRRLAVLERLFTLFEGHDAAAEVRRLEEQDRHW